jgi:hypothetical protein
MAVLVQAATAQAVAIEGRGVRVEYSSPVSEAEARAVLADEIAARDKVSAFLSRPAPPLIIVRIDDGHDGIPYSEDNVIFAPMRRLSWPRVDAAGRLRDNLSLTHETTHVIDAGKLENRFLTEGVAVYVAASVGAVSYPNNGVDLHVCTRQLQDAYGEAIGIQDSEKVRMAALSGLGRQLAYAQEGSFVRWLVETRGLPRFQRVLDAEPPEQVYGKPFGTLEKEWRASLASIPAMEPSCIMKGAGN